MRVSRHPTFRSVTTKLLLFLTLLVAVQLTLACRRRSEAPAPTPPAPTLRLYVVSTLAGALEPCGCVSDMLGGVNHAAAYLQAQAAEAPHRAVLAAGPLLFLNPEIEAQMRTQVLWKAEALASSLKDIGLTAWAPGANDWAAGSSELGRLQSATRATLLAANLSGDVAGAVKSQVVVVGSVKLGLAGVSHPTLDGRAPTGVAIGELLEAATKAEQELVAAGAQVRVLLAAVSRGEGLRLAERVPGYQVVVIGKPFDRGEANDPVIPAVVVGKTLVVQAPNHLQALGVVDLYVKGDAFTFEDGAGLSLDEQRASLTQRLSELDARLDAWEHQGGIEQRDLDARRADRERLRQELAGLAQPATPADASYFRYKLVEIRERLGDDPVVTERLANYYRRVNDHNREAFKDLKPEPAPPGKSSFVGAQTCALCHASQSEFWQKTEHAGAYATLSSQHKEYNLDCVGCHVTGYAEPGGSTVAHVEKLTNVQCETCHGPASRHVDNPTNREWIVAKPERGLCASKCHHPPHVKPDWDVNAAWSKIVGAGHGLSVLSPPTH